MQNSKIQWTDHTWNIAVGCTKVDEDCKYCYMYRDSLDSTRFDPKVVRKTKTVFNSPLKIPVFVKQLGTHLAKELNLKDRHGGDMSEWPEHLRIRQFPKQPTSLPKA